VRLAAGVPVLSMLFCFHTESTNDEICRRLTCLLNSEMNAACTGEPTLSTLANVTVTVVDRAMPVFDNPLYTVTVPESLPQYATLLTVSAQSPTSSSLVYSIIDGNDLGQFAVDFTVGKTVLCCPHVRN